MADIELLRELKRKGGSSFCARRVMVEFPWIIYIYISDSFAVLHSF